MRQSGDMSATEIFVPRKVWTREETKKIDPVLAESLELINGELIDKMAKSPLTCFGE